MNTIRFPITLWFMSMSEPAKAKGRRGVVVFVHTSLEKFVSSIETVSEFEETHWLSLKLRAGDCLLFGVIYRSPSSSESNNLALNTILSTLCVQESPK